MAPRFFPADPAKGRGRSAIAGLVLVIPFLLLEAINRRVFREEFPVVLFVLLWLLPTAFIVALTPIVRSGRAGHGLFASPVRLLLRVAFLTLIAGFWGALVLDQLPCFLGIPNCD